MCFSDFLWNEYNFNGLLNAVLKDMKIEKSIFYFARVSENKETFDKSRQLIEEQRLLKTHLEKQGFEVVLSGRIRGHLEEGFLRKKVLIFKEKGVGVKIAVDMVSWACDKIAETFIVGSSDSDLQPAIAEAKKRKAQCIYLGFEAQPNKGLSYSTNRTILIRNSEVLGFGK